MSRQGVAAIVACRCMQSLYALKAQGNLIMTRDDRSPLWERFKAKFHLKDYPATLRASKTRLGAFHRPRFLQRFRKLPASSMAVPRVVRRARSPEIIELLDASSNHPSGPRDNEARGFGGLELPNDLAAGDFRFDVNAFHLDGNAFADDNGPVNGSAALGEEAPPAFPMDRNEHLAPADDAEYLQHLMELPDIDQPPDPQPQPDPNPHKCSQPDCAAAFPSRHWLAQHERNTHAIQMDQHEIVDIPSDDEAEPDIHQSKAKCIDEVVAILPDISREHVLELFETGVGTAAEQLVVYILDKEENGDRYPRAAKIQTAKRKRSLEDIEDVEKRYRAEARANPSPLAFVRTVLAHEFPESKMSEIDSALEKSGTHLFAAYQVLLSAEKDTDSRKSKRKSKVARALREYQAADFLAANLETTIQTLQAQGKADCVLVLEELRAARRVREEAEAEEENFNQAKATGATLDCGCCFGEYAMNRMFHCSNEDDLHWFCSTCCRRTVETEVGEMRYKVTCMSMDPICTAGFSREQKKLFLSEHTFQLLERLEQQASIREAEIEGLESCPFCNYAAVMPPLAENKEFTCANPECEKVSCRVCKAETHIPKSCEEQKKESGLSKRRIVEEAKSAALIRKCNKCQTPFIKEYGCNKMTCTKCRSLQCYVCSETVTSYDHFNDQARGGKTGNCPLFDTHQALDEGRVQEAEKKAVAQILAEDPDIDEEALKIHVSEAVKKAERDRRGREGAIYGNPYPYPVAAAQGAYGEMSKSLPLLTVLIAQFAGSAFRCLLFSPGCLLMCFRFH